MAILSKGTTFLGNSQLTSAGLNGLVDNATFSSGAVDNITTALSGGAITVKNDGITPSKLSTGHPTWDTNGITTISGTLTTGGSISTSGNVHVDDDLHVTGSSRFYGLVTCDSVIQNIAQNSRTAPLRLTLPGGANHDISFGYADGELLVTIDGSAQFKVTLTPV